MQQSRHPNNYKEDTRWSTSSLNMCSYTSALHIELTLTMCSNVIILASAFVAVRNVRACGSVFAWTYLAGVQC